MVGAQVAIGTHYETIKTAPAETSVAERPNRFAPQLLATVRCSWMLDRCHAAPADSGWIQKDAPVPGCPVLAMSNATPDPDALVARASESVGTPPEGAATTGQQPPADDDAWQTMVRAVYPFRDGRAAGRIAEAPHVRYRFP